MKPLEISMVFCRPALFRNHLQKGNLRHSLAGKSLVPFGRVDEDQPQRVRNGWVTPAGCGCRATFPKSGMGVGSSREGGQGLFWGEGVIAETDPFKGCGPRAP